MRLSLSLLLLLALAAPAAARSSGGGGPVGSSDSDGRGPMFDRDLYLGVSAVVDGAFLLVHGGELALGREPSAAVAGLQVAVAAPTLIYGINFVRAGAYDDPLIVATTAAAAGLIIHSVIVLAGRGGRREPLRPPPITVSPLGVSYAASF